MLLVFYAFKILLKIEIHLDQIESVVSKIIYLFMLPKVSVAF